MRNLAWFCAFDIVCEIEFSSLGNYLTQGIGSESIPSTDKEGGHFWHKNSDTTLFFLVYSGLL